ncbi:uncharacterized protein LOC129168434 isoform X2 [Dunckerocampus dactyliophorus]|uniref:uncharacterized protein LOC129168434 isoform X2 n=1 Tax=Dunckerocampus dactyliophorus TaxID=161453 RepID=UPI002406C1C9|nr:uncharacterized protein LOC129168434 isoform X2 [Dunckerocampus dactyliophorus]
MNSVDIFPVILVTLLLHILYGSAGGVCFSICWMDMNDFLKSYDGSIWLNDTELKDIGTLGKVTSLALPPPGVENKLTLDYGDTILTWSLTISPDTMQTKVSGRHKPQEHPSFTTQVMLDLLDPNEVFPCENGTIFFYQDENFFLAFGHSVSYPIKLQSRSSSTLLFSWKEGQPIPVSTSKNTVTLYRFDQDFSDIQSILMSSSSHYHFTNMYSCTLYIVCVDITDAHLVTCLSTLTDPVVPVDFEVSSWNSSSISLTWGYPERSRFSFFLLTSFHLNGTDHVVEEVHTTENFTLTLSDLQPCSRVRFGLQTVCRAGSGSRYSGMILNDGNTAHSRIEALRLISFGPDNYTLGWEVRNASSIPMVKIYHEGTLLSTTHVTNYTVKGLLPCRLYHARVEALCGDGMTLPVHTAPRGVIELRYRTNDSMALWIPGTHSSALAFSFDLSLENGTTLQTGNMTETELHLPGLEDGKTYTLEVWEQCDGQWESERTLLCFKVDSSTYGFLVRGAGLHGHEDKEVHAVRVVMPGSLPEDVEDEMSEATAAMVESAQNMLEELLSNFHPAVRVELASVEPAAEPSKTEVLLMLFDAAQQEDYMPLPVQHHMDYIESLHSTNVSIRDGVLYWDGPDLCALYAQSCPQNAQCINTLGSYHCACNTGYYDVSAVLQPPAPSQRICNEKGLFSQCLDTVMTGGVAKPYLTSYIGGEVDVKLNDGRCAVEESGLMYHFHTPRIASECGTQRRLNKTHIEFKNTLTVTLTKDEAISRRDLKVVWKCVYPLHYVRNAHVAVDLKWLSVYSLVEFNASLQLGLTMKLFRDMSYSSSFNDFVGMEPEDTLFFEVALDTNNSFASNVLVHVESCWATESSEPQSDLKGIFLQDGCSIDETFRWLSPNGEDQKSRFSLQMFHMPQELPLYFHCLASVCGHKENCTKNCTSHQRTKRATNQIMDTKWKQAAVVSAGPLVVSRGMSGVRLSSWTQHVTMIFIVVGLVSILGLTLLSVSATKAITTIYDRLRRK